MGGMGQKGILLATLIGICEVAAFNAAYAAPPLQKVTAALAHAGSKAQDRIVPRLDLRLPAEVQANEQAAPAAGNHRLFSIESPFRSDTHSPAQAPSGHIMSPMESMAHNFHQDGLPIAKLFQNSTSLVHVGLNPKGKPGLWVVHKLH
jgi:hypothetical protein